MLGYAPFSWDQHGTPPNLRSPASEVRRCYAVGTGRGSGKGSSVYLLCISYLAQSTQAQLRSLR